MVLSEVGAAFAAADDAARTSYLREHLEKARQAAREGVGLRGFFVRSLVDGWEWAEGHSQNFGLVAEDQGGRGAGRSSSGSPPRAGPFAE